MLTQPFQFRRSGKTFNKRIKLATGETQQARFKEWLTEIIKQPLLCEHHSSTTLVLDRTQSEISPGYKTPESYRPFDYPEIEPGAFHFYVAFRCPSCRAAYARCPPEFHEAALGTFNTSTPERVTALATCREFAAQVNQKGVGFLLLVGKTGTGKTRLASGIARELESMEALYVRQGELTIALRATYGRKEVILRRAKSYTDDENEDDTPSSPLEVAQAAPFLIVDELGCTALANDERLLLDELLKLRYDQRKPTVLISNLPLDQLKQFLGDALTDRIRHATGNGKFILQFSGESFRRSDGENYFADIGDVPKPS